MAIRTFSLPSIPEVYNGRRTDYFTIGDVSDIPARCEIIRSRHSLHRWFNCGEWTNHMGMDEALRCTLMGHMPSVAASEKFMAEIENILPAPTARHEIIDDVAGGAPNVPALLAGQPLTMRRKRKTVDESRPIAIVVDCVTSAGISNAQMQQRGAAILALVRALSSRRPVELYFGAGLGAYGDSAQWTFFRMDTAPLDLARAAYFLVHPAFTRGVLYAMGEHAHNFQGAWPYNGDNSEGRTYGRKIIGRALPHIEDMIWVPGAYMTDEAVSEPVEWVRKNVKAHIGDDVQEAA